MDPKRLLFYASVLALCLFAGCQEIPDHSACEQKLDTAKTELQGQIDSMTIALDELAAQNESMEKDVINLRDSISVLQMKSNSPRIPVRTPKGDPIRLDGPKPGELPLGRK